MRRQLFPALVVFLALTLLTGIAYPLAVTGIAQLAFPGHANGSLIERNGRVIGSRLIGQQFGGAAYFQPRPSAAGRGYDAMASAASNLGPTNPALIASVRERAARYRRENRLPARVRVPIYAVTASGSGLDPEISSTNARLQAPRVARARGLPVERVLALVRRYTDGRSLCFLGEAGVNVLELDLALDGARR